MFFFFSSRRRHTRCGRDWSSDVCSSDLARPWLVLAAVAAAAWAVTIVLARNMGNGPGTMGLALLPFLGLWILMMAAMMLPSVAPVAALWTRLIRGVSAGPWRAARMGLFLSGYLLAWAACGAVAFAALAGTGQLLTVSATAAKWLGDRHHRGHLPADPLEGLVPQQVPLAGRRAHVLRRFQGPEPRRPRRTSSRGDLRRVLLGPDDPADRGRRDERGGHGGAGGSHLHRETLAPRQAVRPGRRDRPDRGGRARDLVPVAATRPARRRDAGDVAPAVPLRPEQLIPAPRVVLGADGRAELADHAPPAGQLQLCAHRAGASSTSM